MPKLLVMADDLSGATDVGAQFAKRGIRSFVAIHAGRRKLAELFNDFEVVLVNLESRHVAAEEARLRVTTLGKEARVAGIELFYKKTDSTLRGNVGAELDALLQIAGRKMLCFVPAHPALGRTTRDGVQLVNGVPLHESAYAADARNPARESRVAALLEPETKAPIRLVKQDELARLGQGPVTGLLVFDAETEAEIARIAVTIHLCGRLHVLAGPAAFAACVPNFLTFKKEPPRELDLAPALLVVNGSLNEVALRQCSVAEANGFDFVPMPPVALLSDDAAGEKARETMAHDICTRLAQTRSVVLGSVKHPSELAAFGEAAGQILPGSDACEERIAFNTGRIVAAILSRCGRVADAAGAGAGKPGCTLAIIGGDTLSGVARANEWQGFLPRREILPGVAACEVSEQPGLFVLSKPGGFGDDETLPKLRSAIAAEKGPPA